MKIIDELLELYDDSQTCQYETYQGQIDDELKSKRAEIEAIIIRYFALQDRYLNWDEKHFGELCGNYFDDFPITQESKSDSQ